MQMPGDPRLVGGKIGRIMHHPQSADVEKRHRLHRDPAGPAIVISLDEQDVAIERLTPLRQSHRETAPQRSRSVDQIPGHQQTLRRHAPRQIAQTLQIRRRFPLRHRNAPGPERGRLAQVDIGHDQIPTLRQPNGRGGQEIDGGAGDFETHGGRGRLRHAPGPRESDAFDTG